MLTDVYLAGGVRTPIGGFGGGLAQAPATVLGAAVAREAMARAGVAHDTIDEVIFGNVIGAGLGQNVARQVALGAGLSSRVSGTTVNKVCGSGLKAVMLAAQAIQCGDASCIVAGGTENMSAAPYLLPRARQGYRLGHGELIDAMVRDGLWDVYHDAHMGTFGDRCATACGFTRQQQDEFAIESYQRALAAIEQGAFADEIVSVDVPHGKTTQAVAQDEEPARFDEAKLRNLRPAFDPAGTVTAGNASSINDGAAAVVVASPSYINAHSLTPEARLVGYASHACEPEDFTLAPCGAIERLLAKLDLAIGDIDLFEINEAFAVVPMAAMARLGIPHQKLNVHGGAVALGHPIGASGARVLVTLLHAMQRRDAKRGLATLCIGGGEAVAVAVERV